MQRVNEFSFYELASKVHPLTEASDDTCGSRSLVRMVGARQAINNILSARPLHVCTGAAFKLKKSIDELIPEKWEDLNALLSSEPEKMIPSWKVYGVSSAAKEFETVLAAECQVLDTYFVSKRGAYSTADLVEHAHHQIPLPLRGLLPQQTIDDLDQAGKCIAFDLPTAAAFHLLRGTEAVLRKYYDRIVPGAKKATPKMPNWGVYIKLLKEHGAEVKITSLLDHLRDAYRNPVLHPEENYADQSAQVLFGVCVSAIVMMVTEIATIDLKGALLPLTPPSPSLSVT